MSDEEIEPHARARTPYLRVFVLVAAILPVTLAAHVLVMIYGGPSADATCDHVAAVAPSAWPSAPANAKERCLDDLAKLQSALGPPNALFTRLQTANFRRCLSRVATTADFGHCIEGLNDGWPGQLMRWP